jgi:hypothetical protein
MARAFAPVSMMALFLSSGSRSITKSQVFDIALKTARLVDLGKEIVAGDVSIGHRDYGRSKCSLWFETGDGNRRYSAASEMTARS